MTTEKIITLLITFFAGTGIGSAVVGWLKDRRKDNAAALLTNVEALQKQVMLLVTVTEYLRKENAQLAIDRDNEQDRNRKLRQRLSEVEEELVLVRRTAMQAQHQVEELSKKVRTLATGDDL